MKHKNRTVSVVALVAPAAPTLTALGRPQKLASRDAFPAWLRLRNACAIRLLPVLLLTLPAVLHAQYTYTTNNGTITIIGYDCSGGVVTIPSTIAGLPVTAIEAFTYCGSLTSVTIPNSVTNIGDYAFYSCSILAALTVGALNPVYSTLAGVLYNKSQTTLIKYPEGKAGSYTIPNSVTSIRDRAFIFSKLTSVTIPNSVTNIGDAAFNLCASLTSVTIPNSVTFIGQEAFGNCTHLTSVTIPNSVTSIGHAAFHECTSLTSVTIPNSVTDIEDYAFYSCTSLTNLTIANSVTSIGAGAFGSCTSLINAAIPNSVTNIGRWAFEESGLISVAIPNSVTSIGEGPFYSCQNLTAITVGTSNSAYGSVDGVLFDKSQITLVQYPAGKAGGDYTIPNSVTSIGDYAFYKCTSLTSVTIVNSVTNIGSYAFSFCTSLASVTIGNTVTSIGGHAFENCPNLTSVTIPYSVTGIEFAAFAGCNGLTGVNFQGNAPSVGSYVFYRTDNATVYYLPGTTGWEPTFGGLPTAPWLLPNPLILASGPSFGVQTNQFGFIISWAANHDVVVEAYTDFANPIWVPVATNTLTDGWAYFSDPQWTNHPARFYRLRSP